MSREAGEDGVAEEKCEEEESASASRKKLNAMVFGGTGATGIQVLKTLLRSKRWGSVVSVGRRKASEMLDGEEEVGKTSSKLKEVVVSDMFDDDDMKKAVRGAGQVDSVFVCHGTTRGNAGGAEGFKKIEVGLSNAIANAVIAATPAGKKGPYVSVVSAQGANADLGFAPNWLHPLLYVKTLGQKERVFTDRKDSFRGISLFRPGMLNRLKGDRWHENVMNSLGMGLRVDVLAAAMVKDAQTAIDANEDAQVEKSIVLKFEGNAVITGKSLE